MCMHTQRDKGRTVMVEPRLSISIIFSRVCMYIYTSRIGSLFIQYIAQEVVITTLTILVGQNEWIVN